MTDSVDYLVRPGHEIDAPKLTGIELAAATVIPRRDLPPAMAEEATPQAEFEQAAREGNLIVVALRETDTPVGFALLISEGDHLHLQEIDVHPDHARRGLGGKLVQAVIAHARTRRDRAVTLTTFGHLEWNAPFYARHGFRVLEREELSPELVRHLEEEANSGLDPAKRVAMRYEIDAS